MSRRVALVFNQPVESRYNQSGEEKAVLGVLDEVNAVYRSLRELGCEIVKLPLLPPVEKAAELIRALSVDVIFNLFEGFCGEPETESLVPQVAEEVGIAFTGCPARVLSLALDKAKTKEVFISAGIKTAPYQVLTTETAGQFNLKFPCIIKPVKEDASHGISEDSFVNTAEALDRQVKKICANYGGSALVEEYLTGREFNATVLSNKEFSVFPISEIVYLLPPDKPKILTFDAKWLPGSPYFIGTKAVCPAQITPEEKERIVQVARATFKQFNCRGYARVDMRLDAQGQINALELNPNPDISPGNGAARQAKAAGMSYAQFVDKIITLALEQ